MRFLFFIVLTLALLLSFGNITNAFTETSTGKPMVVEFKPAEPGPNQQVTATLKSYYFDLNVATIDWQINGTSLTTDKDSNSITFTTGAIGSATILKVTATVGQEKNQKTITIRPAGATLVWQADSVVPVNYPGKPLAAAGSEVTVIALPNFIGSNNTALKPEELVYEWSRDHQVIASASGLNKNTLKISGPNGSVGIKISTIDKTITAATSIQMSPAKPKVLFYENHPLNGLMTNKALNKDLKLTGDEITIKAEPFYFSNNSLKFNWQLNRNPFTPSSGLPNQALFGKPTSGSGESQINVEASNPDKPNQNANTVLKILFGKSNSSL